MIEPTDLIVIDGPHDGREINDVRLYPGDTLNLDGDERTTYRPVLPYPSIDTQGRLRLTCDPSAAMSDLEVLRWQRRRARANRLRRVFS